MSVPELRVVILYEDRLPSLALMIEDLATP